MSFVVVLMPGIPMYYMLKIFIAKLFVLDRLDPTIQITRNCLVPSPCE